MKKTFVILAVICLLPVAALAGTLTLGWEYSDFANIDGFRVYQDGVKVAEVVRADPAADPATTWTTGALVEGRRYCWHVTAYSAEVESLPSNTVCTVYAEQEIIELPGSPRRLILEFAK